MLRCGERVWLTQAEKALLSELSHSPCNPETVDDLATYLYMALSRRKPPAKERRREMLKPFWQLVNQDSAGGRHA